MNPFLFFTCVACLSAFLSPVASVLPTKEDSPATIYARLIEESKPWKEPTPIPGTKLTTKQLLEQPVK